MRNTKFTIAYKRMLLIGVMVLALISNFSCGIRIEKEYINYENSITIANEDIYKNLENNLYRIVNNNVPNFDLKKYDGKAFEKYSDLDELGRCGPAEALIGEEIMPKPNEKRGSIGMVKPSGWPTPQQKYDIVEGKFLYNLVLFNLLVRNLLSSINCLSFFSANNAGILKIPGIR